MFAVVAVELLPDVRREHSPIEIGVGFVFGVGLMLGLRHMTGKEKEAEGERGGWPWGLLTAVGVDLLIDGILLGTGFAAGAKEGILLAIALALECLSLGLATAATLGKVARAGRVTVIAATAALALPFLVGATGGTALLQWLSGHTLAGVLAFGCAALLFLVTEELLVEAHEVRETPAITAMFFAGFLLFLLLGMFE